jgi:hypothetical protein
MDDAFANVMNHSNAIPRLINACLDDERMLEHESRSTQGYRRNVLEDLAEDRTRFVRELRELGYAESAWHTGVVERLRELGRSFRGVLGGPSGADSVAACRRSCRRTASVFDEALDLEWPARVRAILNEQRARLDDSQRSLNAIQY